MRSLLALLFFVPVPGAISGAAYAHLLNAAPPADGAYRFTQVADVSGISVQNAWARASPGAATTGAAYFTVADTGAADRLTGVSTPVAAMAELHETIDDHGVMKMRPVEAIPLDPGKPVTLKPGGYHVMLTGLKAPLVAGTNFPLTLQFEHAKPVTVTITVGVTGAPAADGSHMMDGDMKDMGGMHGNKM